jgi:hypothetical protein
VRCERVLHSGQECRSRRNEQRAACAWLTASTGSFRVPTDEADGRRADIAP